MNLKHLIKKRILKFIKRGDDTVSGQAYNKMEL